MLCSLQLLAAPVLTRTGKRDITHKALSSMVARERPQEPSDPDSFIA